MRSHILLCSAALLCGARPASAQATDKLYFTHSMGMNDYYLATYDLATGVVDDLAQIPVSTSSLISSCIDVAGARYYFCSGTALAMMDALNVLPSLMVSLPLPPGTNFRAIEYDPCDSMVLGIVQDSDSTRLMRYDLFGTQQLTYVATLGAVMAFPGGGQALFDPVSRLYMIRHADGFMGVDVSTGAIVYDTPINDPPGFTPLHHLAYDCSTQRIYGTAVGPGVEGGSGKHLCRLDPGTGDVTVLTTAPVQNGIYKPSSGGTCIDQANGTFYWSAAGDSIVGADLSNGAGTYAQAATDGYVYLIEHFSWCNCSAAAVHEARPTTVGLTITPNPAVNTLHISRDAGAAWITVHDHLGRVVMSFGTRGTDTEVDVNHLNPGVYVLRADGALAGRFVIRR